MYNLYVVSPGDTIESIAQTHNVTPQELYAINSFLNPNEPLSVGQRIIVPVPKTRNFEYYTIKKGDTLYNIASRYNISVRDLALLNGLKENEYLYPGQVILVPTKGVEIIITKSGETLGDVIRKLNTNLEQLILQNPNIILEKDQVITYKKSSV